MRALEFNFASKFNQKIGNFQRRISYFSEFRQEEKFFHGQKFRRGNCPLLLSLSWRHNDGDIQCMVDAVV